jgi:Putative metallopeptidase
VLGTLEAKVVEEEGITVPIAVVPDVMVHGVKIPGLCCWVPLLVAFCSAEPAFTQPAPIPSDAVEPSAPAAPAEAAYRGSGGFQAKIDAAALVLRDSDPKLKQYSPKRMQAVAEFVVGNMLFVLMHETGHAAITQMGLPVLGRMEDAADTFAALRLIRIGSDFSHRVLTQAAQGWFMADRRDRDTGDKVAFYDEHQLNQQRAYQIVCLMVGSDADKYKDLAAETKLPEERQETCLGDFSNAAYSWDLLAAHAQPRSAENQDRRGVRCGRRQERAREAGLEFGRGTGNDRRSSRRSIRVAGTLHPGNGELRFSQRSLGSANPQAYAVLRTRHRLCRPLSQLRASRDECEGHQRETQDGRAGGVQAEPEDPQAPLTISVPPRCGRGHRHARFSRSGHGGLEPTRFTHFGAAEFTSPRVRGEGAGRLLRASKQMSEYRRA